MREIKAGDRVRSFDFAFGEFGRELIGDPDSERAAYVEGIVKGIGDWDGCAGGCEHYYIKVDVDVFRGEEQTSRVGSVVYPPVHDVLTEGSVELIKEGK